MRTRYFSFTLSEGSNGIPMTLACNEDLTVFHRDFVGLKGYAAANAVLHVRNRSTSQIYFWNSGVTVGAGPNAIAYRIGDDICPKNQGWKSNLGYGWFDGGNSSTVRVVAQQGSSPCEYGQLELLPDSILRVWIEDPDPECQGKDIKLVSKLRARNKMTSF